MSASISPGGALLRASRVFAIPKPLARPQEAISSVAVFQSDTATLSHPIHLSITTPQSSQARGDWGFKRPLPLRSTTRTSTPVVRVEAIDCYERVTEFYSAADHTLSLQKWQEMGIPLSVPDQKDSDAKAASFLSQLHQPGTSVFEEDLDVTGPVDGRQLGLKDTRWKFKGPWLAGMEEGAFEKYVRKSVGPRKMEFRNFLRIACALDLSFDQNRKAREDSGDILPPIEAGEVTEEQFNSYIKKIREEKRELYRLVREFLDLAPPPNPRMDGTQIFDDLNKSAQVGLNWENYNPYSNSPYANKGPPKTHPSAGLSYSRTASHLFNHPVYGPQEFHPPVEARVVMPRGAATGSFLPVLGVGGFVVNIPNSEVGFNMHNKNKADRIQGYERIDPKVVGGHKTWVRPTTASIAADGTVQLAITTADPEAVAVKKGTAHLMPSRDDPHGKKETLRWSDAFKSRVRA